MYSAVKSGLFLLLSVGLSQCQDDQCPAPTDVYPCTCYSGNLGIRVSCDGDKKSISINALQKSLRKLYGKNIEYLYLKSINMEQASSDILNNLVIQEAVLFTTNITDMPTFKGSENTLQILKLGYKAVSERSIEKFTLKVNHLNKLKSFHFTRNFYISSEASYITASVDNNWFKNFSSLLEKVNLHGNWAKSFGDRAFSELVNLKEINLDFNQIKEVHRRMFPDPARHLLSIDLQYNLLKSLPEDIFSNMPVLVKVNISGNKISVLNQRTWSPVWERLDYLKLGSVQCDSTISWTFKKEKPKQLEGKCEHEKSYKGYRGKSLKAVIDFNRLQGLSSNTN